MARKRIQRLAWYFSAIVKLNPSYLAFLSGLFVSISINLLTDLVFGDPNANKLVLEWWVVGVFLIASFVFAKLAWDLEKPHQHWVLHWRDTLEHYGLQETDIVNGAIKDRLSSITMELLIGIIFSFAGIILMVCSAIPPK
jgi:hypothetical protein